VPIFDPMCLQSYNCPVMPYLLHNDLQWLTVPERVNYKLNITTVHRLLVGESSEIPGRFGSRR